MQVVCFVPIWLELVLLVSLDSDYARQGLGQRTRSTIKFRVSLGFHTFFRRSSVTPSQAMFRE